MKSKLRIILKWAHVILGLILMCYVYSPLSGNPTFQIAVKFFVVPVIAFTGFWMWKFKSFNKFFRIPE